MKSAHYCLQGFRILGSSTDSSSGSGAFSRRRRDPLQEKMLQGSKGYEHTVYTIWEVSLRMIAALSTEAGRDAIELLQMFSFFHFDGIPEEVLPQAWENSRNNIYPEWVSSHQLKYSIATHPQNETSILYE